MELPKRAYGRIAPRSGLTIKKHLTTMAGVIDQDYRGELQVIIQNAGSGTQIIKDKEKIAQLILENAEIAEVQEIQQLTKTDRGTKGFGSTDIDRIVLPKGASEMTPTTAMAATLHADIETTFEMPFNITLSTDPYDNKTYRTIQVKSTDNATIGMVLEMCKHRNLPKLIDCHKGNSFMRVPKWRSELRHSYITEINGVKMQSVEDIVEIIKSVRETNSRAELTIEFSTISKQAMHPQLGVPQLYHDQLHTIAKHLWEMKTDQKWTKDENEAIVYDKMPNVGNIAHLNKLQKHYHNLPTSVKAQVMKKRSKLTRSKLMKQEDWNDWEKSEFKQLNQYEAQGTFGDPCVYPAGENLLPVVWTYLIKDDGTKKARCTCNGSPKQKGSVTLAETFAKSLDHTSSSIFWAATALNNYITIGADASNAFAEAPPPKAPLYIRIDRQYRNWYKKKYPDKPDIPHGYVLPVKGAMQGHPESPRLWAKLIDRIIQELNLTPCTHEPCLYYTKNYNGTGKTVLFLRQVDDFAVSCEDEATATQVIDDINSRMTIDVKKLGMVNRYNGIDVEQTRDYIKLYNRTYLEKILLKHLWWINTTDPPATFPTPMHESNAYQRKLETAEFKDDVDLLEKEFKFGYRSAIGELIYAMVTCRPDISYAVIKLSQYSTRPCRVHFEAIKQVFKYLHSTIDEGITYWRKEKRHDLPYKPNTAPRDDLNYNNNAPQRKEIDHRKLTAAVDSDYAGDTDHRRSVTGMILKMAGGTIFYKTQYQQTVAASSTEAEFTAAADAGKQILYVRSLLEEIGIPQAEATTLYEDNEGALLMANAQKPTKRSKHMEVKTFILQDWVERDILVLERIATADNFADVFTKAQGRTLFYRHMDFIMGRVRPEYTKDSTDSTCESVSKKYL